MNPNPSDSARRDQHPVPSITLVGDGLPVYENRAMKPRQVVAAADPRPGGDGNLVLVVGDLHLFRTRVELQGDIKAMFDAERVRLGLPVTVN